MSHIFAHRHLERQAASNTGRLASGSQVCLSKPTKHFSTSGRAMGSIASASNRRIEPGPGQESVWDYPRPPACEKSNDHVILYLDGQILADTTQAYRVLETSHPPVYYIPPSDIKMDQLVKHGSGQTYCEWKGSATYFNAKSQKNIAWTYEQPSSRFAAIKDYLAFYPSKLDKATVNGEEAERQEGDFYGGMITSKIVGPFKGGVGTWGW